MSAGRCPDAKADGAQCYIYCITACDRSMTFGPIGIGADSPEVFSIAHEGLEAVVSHVSGDTFDISREHVLTHQRVMEAVMERGGAILPVRFNTIAENKAGKSAEGRIVEHVLAKRADEFSSLLAGIGTCVELGVKGLWTDVSAVFDDIVSTNEPIKSLRKKLLAVSAPPARRRPSNLMAAQMKLGEMVKNALEAKKAEAEKRLVAHLTPMVADVRKNKTFGDGMFANLALLAENSRQDEIVSALSAFETQYAGQASGAGCVKLRCVGPVPPSNFIELVITWDD